MPFAKVRVWDQRLYSAGIVGEVMGALPALIATHLHVEEVDGPDPKAAQLTPNDIEVILERGDTRDIHGDYEISVSIEAKYFPEREAILDNAGDFLRSALNDLLPTGMRGLLWITTPPAHFQELQGLRNKRQ